MKNDIILCVGGYMGYDLNNNSKILYYSNFSDLQRISNLSSKKKIFYQIKGLNNYLVEYYRNSIPKKVQKEYIDLFMVMIGLQKKFNDIDFPIGFFKENNEIRGVIVPYYNSPSLKTIMNSDDLFRLFKYFQQDDDLIHNIFILFQRIIDLLEHMFDNRLYYLDVHPGNFVFQNNDIKIIDFEIPYVIYNKKERKSLNLIMNNFGSLVYDVLKHFLSFDMYLCLDDKNFKDAKLLIKTAENNVRKGMR